MRAYYFYELISNEKQTINSHSNILSIHADQHQDSIIDGDEQLENQTFVESFMNE